MESSKIVVVLLCMAIILLLAVVAMRIDADAEQAGAGQENLRCAKNDSKGTAARRAAPYMDAETRAIRESPLRGAAVSVDKNDAYILAQMAWGEARGCTDMEIAATMWCVLNRCDAWGLSVVEAVCAPGQFCGWSSGNPLDSHIYKLAVDVLTRWELERAGQTDVGRVLPAAYLWFTGDGKHNAFKDAYQGGNVWDWSLPDVYGEAGK